MSKTGACSSYTGNNAAFCLSVLHMLFLTFIVFLSSWHSCNIKTFLNSYLLSLTWKGVINNKVPQRGMWWIFLPFWLTWETTMTPYWSLTLCVSVCFSDTSTCNRVYAAISGTACVHMNKGIIMNKGWSQYSKMSGFHLLKKIVDLSLKHRNKRYSIALLSFKLNCHSDIWPEVWQRI